jgi:hypothetical protein
VKAILWVVVWTFGKRRHAARGAGAGQCGGTTESGRNSEPRKSMLALSESTCNPGACFDRSNSVIRGQLLLKCEGSCMAPLTCEEFPAMGSSIKPLGPGRIWPHAGKALWSCKGLTAANPVAGGSLPQISPALPGIPWQPSLCQHSNRLFNSPHPSPVLRRGKKVGARHAIRGIDLYN